MMTSRTGSMLVALLRRAAERQAQHSSHHEYSAEDEPGGPGTAGQVDVDQPEEPDGSQDRQREGEEQDEQPGDDVAHEAFRRDHRLVPHGGHGVLALV